MRKVCNEMTLKLEMLSFTFANKEENLQFVETKMFYKLLYLIFFILIILNTISFVLHTRTHTHIQTHAHTHTHNTLRYPVSSKVLA